MIVLDTGHIHSAAVAAAFAEGVGAPVLRPPWPEITEPIFVYGKLRGTLDAVAAAKARGLDWVMADNGYIRAGHYGGFYRITRNALQLGPGADGQVGDPTRVRALGIEIKSWRTTGREILVCPPIAKYNEVMRFDGEAWLAETLRVLARVTSRPVRVRRKPGEKEACFIRLAGGKTAVAPRPLAEDLAAAFALVTHDSNVAVEALLEGIPVCVTGHSPAARMGISDPRLIERPRYPDTRAQWLAWLAANQWTLAEMRSGRCRRDLQKQELAA